MSAPILASALTLVVTLAVERVSRLVPTCVATKRLMVMVVHMEAGMMTMKSKTTQLNSPTVWMSSLCTGQVQRHHFLPAGKLNILCYTVEDWSKTRVSDYPLTSETNARCVISSSWLYQHFA
jgi:hypothetical protein